jgi:hypothetical protein
MVGICTPHIARRTCTLVSALMGVDDCIQAADGPAGDQRTSCRAANMATPVRERS